MTRANCSHCPSREVQIPASGRDVQTHEAEPDYSRSASQASRFGRYFEGSFRSRRFILRHRILKSAARSSRHHVCPGRPLLPPSQPGSLRHYHRSTATVEGSRHGQSLHTTVFRTHARPPQGWWYCHVLVAHLPTDDRRNESNPARLSQCLPECVGLGDVRFGMDYDGKQRSISTAGYSSWLAHSGAKGRR